MTQEAFERAKRLRDVISNARTALESLSRIKATDEFRLYSAERNNQFKIPKEANPAIIDLIHEGWKKVLEDAQKEFDEL